MCGRDPNLCADYLLVKLESWTKDKSTAFEIRPCEHASQPSPCDGLLAPKGVEYRQPQVETAYLETTAISADSCIGLGSWLRRSRRKFTAERIVDRVLHVRFTRESISEMDLKDEECVVW